MWNCRGRSTETWVPPRLAALRQYLAQDLAPLRERHLCWADLMARVFELDVLECPRCSGRCEVIAVITEPQVIRPFLACLGLSTRAPPITPARPAPQPDLEF